LEANGVDMGVNGSSLLSPRVNVVLPNAQMKATKTPARTAQRSPNGEAQRIKNDDQGRSAIVSQANTRQPLLLKLGQTLSPGGSGKTTA